MAKKIMLQNEILEAGQTIIVVDAYWFDVDSDEYIDGYAELVSCDIVDKYSEIWLVKWSRHTHARKQSLGFRIPLPVEPIKSE